MSLPEPLLRMALLGSEKSQNSPDIALQTEFQSESPEAQLLLTVCQTILREQAGYVARQSPLPLRTPCGPASTTRCSDSAMRYLRLMLRGVHSFALQEWCIVAQQAGQHVQEDVLPKLLNLGQNQSFLRPFLLSVLGERGMWLVLEITNQNWWWVFDTPSSALADVIARKQQQEPEIAEHLVWGSSVPAQGLSSEVQRHRIAWSPRLTTTLLDALQAIPSRQKQQWLLDHLARQIVPLIYFFPLEIQSEILKCFNRAPAFSRENHVYLLECATIVFEFRRNMLNALHAPKE